MELKPLLYYFPLRDDEFRRNHPNRLTDGITREDLRNILNSSPVKIFNRQCVLVFGSFPKEMVENAKNEIIETVVNPRGFTDFVEPLKEYLLNESKIIYFTGAFNFNAKPYYFKDAVDEIVNMLADINNTAIIARDVNEIQRFAFKFFMDVKYKKDANETNGLIALHPIIPAVVIPDLCNVCIAFIERQNDCKKIQYFIRRRKVVIPILINNIQNETLNSIFEAIEYAFNIERNRLILRENNYKKIAEILSSIVDLGGYEYYLSALDNASNE